MACKKIVWGLPGLVEVEAKFKVMAETLKEEAKLATEVAENTRRNGDKDRTLECVRTACLAHALAVAKGGKKVRFPSAEKLAVESMYVRKPYFKWINRLKISVYLEDLRDARRVYPRRARM